MLPLAAVLCSSALAFHLAPATTPAVRSTLHRGASTRMLIETGVLDAIMPGYQAPVLPPEFAELAQPPSAEHHARFSDTLMDAVGLYVIISGGSTFWPRIKAKLTGEDPVVSEEAINKYLNSLPISSFGWHQPTRARRYRCTSRSSPRRTRLVCTRGAGPSSARASRPHLRRRRGERGLHQALRREVFIGFSKRHAACLLEDLPSAAERLRRRCHAQGEPGRRPLTALHCRFSVHVAGERRVSVGACASRRAASSFKDAQPDARQERDAPGA